MIAYNVVHHIAGRIRLKVPLIQKLVFAKNIPAHIKDLSFISLPSGIKDVRANPFAGSLVITYEPDEIDVLAFIKSTLDSLSTNAEVQNILSELKCDGMRTPWFF